MEKLKNFCSSSVNVIFSVMSATVAVLILLNTARNYFSAVFYDMVTVIIFALIIIIATALLYICIKSNKVLKRTLSTHPLLTVTLIMGVVVILQALIAREVYAPIGWDVGSLVSVAGNLHPENTAFYDKYFTWYPNNTLLTAMFKVFHKMLKFVISDVWLSSILLSVLAVDAGIVFISLTAKRIFGLKAYYFTFWFCLLTLAFNPTLTVPYSDSVALPFTAGFLFSIAMLKTGKTKRVKLFWSFAAGFLLIVGYYIKPTVLIAGIAAVIWLLLSARKTTLKRAASFALSAVLLFTGIASGVLINRIARPLAYTETPTEQERYDLEIPMTHFLMMGLNENGNKYFGFFEEDVLNTQSILGKGAKKEFHKEVILQRLKNFGLRGFIRHCTHKAIWVTTDGTFCYGAEGIFHAGVPKKTEGIGGFLQNFTYKETKLYQKYFANYMQAVWLLTAIGIAFNIFAGRKKYTGEQNSIRFIAQLSLIGLIAFLMLFEARSRYLFLYLPYFILLASTGYRALAEFIKSYKHN